MFKGLVVLSVVTAALAAVIPDGMTPQLDGRIIGGEAAKIESAPWQVSIQLDGKHICGGAIYLNTIVLTAAHCLPGVKASSLKVVAGSSDWKKGGILSSVINYIYHENYNPVTMANDIAVVRLSSYLNYSNSIKAIPLSSITPSNGANAVVSGWGSTAYGYSVFPNDLQMVNVNIIGNTQCKSPGYGYGSEIEPSMFCASAVGKDTCQGDSGGPLVSNGALAGIASWGYGCAFANFPGVYTDIFPLRSWIISAANRV